jgi:quercetin dioxygenase-like cupin family protein
MTTLRFRDGHEVEILAETPDELRLRHRWPAPGRLAGPHWHPVLVEEFTVVRGRVAFRLGRGRRTVGPGETVAVPAGTVHAFASEKPDLVLDHVVRPPAQHRRMFEFWHSLDAAGRTSRAGVPRNPLDLALLWSLQDGYLAGPPAWLQRMVLGPLARLAARAR